MDRGKVWEKEKQEVKGKDVSDSERKNGKMRTYRRRKSPVYKNLKLTERESLEILKKKGKRKQKQEKQNTVNGWRKDMKKMKHEGVKNTEMRAWKNKVEVQEERERRGRD